MVTPLLDYDTLDAAGLERLIEHILGGRVQGLFILGTTGEAPSLSYRLRQERSLPLFLYNQPAHTKVPFESDTVRRAAQR